MEEEIFKKTIVNYTKLLEYGFMKENNMYLYSKVFMNNKFKAIITIQNNKVLCKVIDLNTNDEYTPLKVKC